VGHEPDRGGGGSKFRELAIFASHFLPATFDPRSISPFRYGPQPSELGGQRALDFVLDNQTLQDFNRTLLFDIKLLTVRK
jgi:hypothetical protein